MAMKPLKGAPPFPPAKAQALAALVDYATDAIVSRSIHQAQPGSITLFAFDAGQELSEHTAPFNAFVQVLDGRAVLTVGGEQVDAESGDLVLMPAGVPHAVQAKERFKMLLTMLRS